MEFKNIKKPAADQTPHEVHGLLREQLISAKRAARRASGVEIGMIRRLYKEGQRAARLARLDRTAEEEA